MPLTKLFQKRHSLKETSLVQETNKELQKLKSSFEDSRKIETTKAQSESNLMASNIDIDTDMYMTESLTVSSATVDEDISNKYEYIEKEYGSGSFHEKNFNTGIRRQSAPAEASCKRMVKTNKSASCSEQQSTSKASITCRKKCISESNANDFEVNDGNSSEKFILDHRKLEGVIGQCINRIIQESMLEAVKNIDVDGIYEETIENISKRRQNSVNNGPENEENCNSDVAEYIELDKSSINYKMEESEDQDNFDEENKSNDTVSYSEDKKIETYSLGGYSADLEESMSLHSRDVEFKDQSAVNGSFSDDVNVEEGHILSEKPSHTSVTSNVGDGGTINDGEESLFSNASTEISELSSPIKIEPKNINLTHDVQISELKCDSISSCSKTSENEEESANNDCQTQNLADTIGRKENQSSTDKKCENIDNVLDEESNLAIISDVEHTPPKTALCHRDSNDSILDSVECLPQLQTTISEEKKTTNWKLGYLHVKLPHKERGKKAHLKAWKKRCVSIQPDEFVNDPKNPCLMLSLYSAESGTARKHGATFWKSISCHKAAVFRSSSRSHRYAFTITDENNVVIHLAAESETSSQEWMSAIRSILWPPSPVVQLEKMLYGKEFEVSIVDNDFSFRAGLLGMYGYLTITEKKLILVHPQQGYVVQEWYLNTVDKFELIPQAKIEDAHKVLSMSTCSDSSTGKGEILMYCPEAVAMLQSIASTIHQILTVHIKQKGGKYDKELAEIADWLVPTILQDGETPEDYYKVPPRQVKSLLDIPNFIFDKPLTPSTTVTCSPDESMESRSLETAKTNITRASQDSGISAGNVSEDMLNCSSSSFLVGGGQFPGKSSDSELSDSYTPPRSPLMETKLKKIKNTSTLQIP